MSNDKLKNGEPVCKLNRDANDNTGHLFKIWKPK